MIWSWKLASKAILLAASFIIVPLVAFVIIALLLWEINPCNIHGNETSFSPNGTWRATWSTKGCTEFSVIDIVDWHSKVIVAKLAGPAKRSYLIFKSDSAYNVILTWPKRNELHIEVPRAANITQSDRNVPGLSVSYGVPRGVLRDLATRLNYDDHQITLIRKKAASGSPLANGKINAKVDESDRQYLDQFRAWARDYTQPPHP